MYRGFENGAAVFRFPDFDRCQEHSALVETWSKTTCSEDDVVEDDVLERLRRCANDPEKLERLSRDALVPIDQITNFVIHGLNIADIDVYALARALST